MKTIAWILAVLVMGSVNAFSETVQFGILANGDVVMAHGEFQAKQTFGTIAAGGALAYADGDYTIGEGMVALRSDRLVPGLRYGLGFKGYFGEVDDEGGSYDGTFAALGFLLELNYELTKAFNPVEVPVEAYVTACFVPSSLAFEDTDQYQEYKAGFRFHLLESAFVAIEGIYRKFDFRNTTRGEWDRDDTIVTAGLTLRL